MPQPVAVPHVPLNVQDKAKIRIESRSVVDCPEVPCQATTCSLRLPHHWAAVSQDMRCAIDGKVMVNPVHLPVFISAGIMHGTLGTRQVLSRYGHHFERKTLEKWFGNCGSAPCSDAAVQ